MVDKIDKKLDEVAGLKQSLQELSQRMDDLAQDAKQVKPLREVVGCDCQFIDGQITSWCSYHSVYREEAEKYRNLVSTMMARVEEMSESVDASKPAVRSLTYHYLKIGEILAGIMEMQPHTAKSRDSEVPETLHGPVEFVSKNRTVDLIKAENREICHGCLDLEGCDLVDKDLQNMSPACGKYRPKEGKSE
jgi:hypothetical protein